MCPISKKPIKFLKEFFKKEKKILICLVCNRQVKERKGIDCISEGG